MLTRSFNYLSVSIFAAFFLITSCLFAHGSNLGIDADFAALEAAVKTYKIKTGVLPDPEIGFRALIERPKSLPPDKEWIKIMTKEATDPWGNPYHYATGSGYPNGFGIYSTGPDGVSKTQGNDPNDWNSWSENLRGIDPSLMRHWKTIGLIIVVSFFTGIYLSKLIHKKNTKKQRT